MDVLALQVSIFGNFKSIEPNQENIIALMQELGGFLPSTLNAISIDPSGNVETVQRIHMLNKSEGWNIEVQLDRINATYNLLVKDPDYSKLVASGVSLLKRVVRVFKIEKKYSRLAVNTRIAIPTDRRIPQIPFMSELPSYLSSINDLVEWNITLNKKGRLSLSADEYTNEILTYALGTAVGDPTKHAILVTADINTIQDNTTERFSMNELDVFSSYAVPRIRDMIGEIISNIGE